MKKTYFISGLPRSGSTLLCNILNQNPNFHATGTSGVLGIVKTVRDLWNNSAELMASYNEDAKLGTLRGVFNGYYENVDKDVIFDKSRGWTGYVELANNIVDDEAKIIACVRDLPDILASFEKIFRANAGKNVFPQEKGHPVEWRTIEGRCAVMAHATQPLGFAYNCLKDAHSRGYDKQIHLVEFDELTMYPEETLSSIYDFLGEERFEHDFEHVEQTIKENDLFHGIDGLHDIRPKVKHKKSEAFKILGEELVNKYSKQEFWR